ncbi:DUF202 domain-containing protein [Glaciibacter superstes]|uniref:DUF202 domain-containing protein n=1 Tax=Glaciibacter superstes TaxID=501023 RepID=UPI0003B639B1|nr:DUF202 domain-containing protein [Glaciibacter superstes]
MSEDFADDRPFDVGLQAERTLLAWQRTVLSLAVGCAIAIRLTVPTMGIGGALVGMAGLGLAVTAYVGIARRHRTTHLALRSHATLRGVSAWPLAAVAVSTVVLGILAALFIFGVLQPGR